MAVANDDHLCTDLTAAAVTPPSPTEGLSDVRWQVLDEPHGDELCVPRPDPVSA